jgi:hypothetical protein
VTAFDQALEAALRGGRHSPPAEPRATEPGLLDEFVARAATSDRSRDILAVAGAWATYRNAGGVPLTDTGALPDPAGADLRRPLGRAAADRSASLLATGDDESLPEWCELMLHSGCAPPREQLPLLLDAGARLIPLREALRSIAGPVGAWLAAMNPQWAWPAGDPGRVWTTGALDDRCAALAALRARDPVAARALLAGVWEAESPPARARLVGALATGLSAADEPFLEAALDDRPAEVRAAAVALLARLDGSALLARMRMRSEALVRVETGAGGATLSVVLPREHDAAMARDGVARIPPGGTGERAWWLIQLLGHVPPSHWGQRLGATAGELIAAATGHQWSRALLTGWSHAAAGFGDQSWCAALIRAGAPSAREALLATPGTWSPELSRAAVDLAAEETVALAAHPERRHALAALLRTAAMRVDPELSLEGVAVLLGEPQGAGFLATVERRRMMRREILDS